MTIEQSTSAPPALRTLAHVGPLVTFLVCLIIPDLMSVFGFDRTDATHPWYVTAPEQWVFPLQTLLTLGVLVCFRRQYDFRPFTGLALAALIGTLGIVIWIAPGFLFGFFEMNQSVLKYLGFVHRLDGFNPSSVAAHNGSLYCAVVAMRFVRLVIVVPLAEEIFWRGFLMRYLTDPDGDFWQVPFGTHHWRSFVMVTAMFMLAHASVDYAPALVFGSLMYWLAVRTKSLSACVLAHAVANLILGVYVMVSQQWGYW
ncbi:MAG TPA: CAAX prenyl protease-related protein [Planctomycetes bacterium]|nr:CAAX prenyl protease-related protein [Fuerstiella sp.]HIK91803.1 CAAX prenyl protease-related protein [Planctomycetota bacterium]